MAKKKAKPKKPPAGWYDPSIDAAERAGGRGLDDLRLDTERDQERASTAFVTQSGRIGTDKGYSLADLLRSNQRQKQDLGFQREDTNRGFSRGSEDLDRTLGRGTEDYGLATKLRTRRFEQQGVQQASGAQAAGVAGGGALAASLAARNENKGIEQGIADTDFKRLGEDVGTSRTRLTEDRDTSLGRIGVYEGRADEDYGTGVDRTNEAARRALEDVGTNYQYTSSDLATNLQRAGREQTFFGQDSAALRSHQAAAAGYQPPKPQKPKRPKKGSLADRLRGTVAGRPQSGLGRGMVG